MAPTGMVDTLGWFSSPEVGIISLVVFLVLSISLVVLCMRCNRQSGNAYDVSGTTTSGANGNVASKSAGSVGEEQEKTHVKLNIDRNTPVSHILHCSKWTDGRNTEGREQVQPFSNLDTVYKEELVLLQRLHIDSS
ncbi:uncharacterized protein V6R79_016575 [Siganus canaliculatus]